jgi:hypothetical protein
MVQAPVAAVEIHNNPFENDEAERSSDSISIAENSVFLQGLDKNTNDSNVALQKQIKLEKIQIESSLYSSDVQAVSLSEKVIVVEDSDDIMVEINAEILGDDKQNDYQKMIQNNSLVTQENHMEIHNYALKTHQFAMEDEASVARKAPQKASSKIKKAQPAGINFLDTFTQNSDK